MIIIYCTFPNTEDATKISRNLLEKNLVSCANIMSSCKSLYWWKGNIESAEEVVVIYKTRNDLFEIVEKEIKSYHSYDVPCIVSWDIDKGHGPFMDWIQSETKGKVS